MLGVTSGHVTKALMSQDNRYTGAVSGYSTERVGISLIFCTAYVYCIVPEGLLHLELNGAGGLPAILTPDTAFYFSFLYIVTVLFFSGSVVGFSLKL